VVDRGNVSEFLEHRVGEVDRGVPFLPVQQLDPHGRPEGRPHRVEVTVAIRAERGHRARGADLVRESPEGEVHSVVGMNDSTSRRICVGDIGRFLCLS